MSPVRIFPAPSAVSAVRAPSPGGRRSGDRRSAARTATIPAPATPAGHPSGTAAVAENGTAEYKGTGTPGIRRGVSNHFSYLESLPKARNHGQNPRRRVATGTPSPRKRAHTVTGTWKPRQPANTLIYMALTCGWSSAGTSITTSIARTGHWNRAHLPGVRIHPL